MKKFYVECGSRDWIISADDSLIKDGILLFTRNSVLVAAFNSESWDVVKVYDQGE